MAAPKATFEKPACFTKTFAEIASESFHDTYERSKDEPFMQQIARLYNKRMVKNFKFHRQPRIPKIIHQIWIGGDLPQKYHAMRDTWIKNHPDWQYKLWSYDDILKLGLINEEKFKSAKNRATQADMARYEILYKIGGLYVDTDTECLKPFDIFHHSCDFYAGNFKNSAEICYLGSRPGNTILKTLIDLLGNSDPGVTSFWDVLMNSGPGLFRRALSLSLDKCPGRCVIFPQAFFMPLPDQARFSEAISTHEQVKKWIRPESFAIHYWHSTWSAGAFK